jgi:hypothetical protein
MYRILPLLAVAALIWSGCGERIIVDPPFEDIVADQQQYFPLEIGQYIVYQVDSVTFDFAQGGGVVRDSSRTFIRETVADTIRDNTGALQYTIERYERQRDIDPWRLSRIWTAAITRQQVIRTEDNLRFLRLIFPMDRRSEWNGNVWIDPTREIEIEGERMRPFSNWQYEVDSIDIAQQIGTFAFDSVLIVTEADDTNIIEQRISRSKYAKHIGLVWREQRILDSQYCNQTPAPADCATKPWDEKAERGYILRQVVLEYH